MGNNNNMITSCLLGAVIFLGLYLLFTSWCNQKDMFSFSPTTQALESEIGANYGPADEDDYYSPEGYEDTTIQDEAEKDTLDFYHNFPSEPMRIGKTLAFQDAATNRHNKELRYC